MKLMQSLLVFALAGAMVASAHAADATFNMGPLDATPYINTRTVVAGPQFTLPNTGTTPYNFTDTYNFSIAGLPSLAGTTVTVNLDLVSLGFHISNLRLDLFDAGDTWLVGDMVANASDVSVSVATPLNDGNYYFKVRGFADGLNTNQGIYTFTAAAVPEAGTYAMMLAGLGLVGFMVVRRRSV